MNPFTENVNEEIDTVYEKQISNNMLEYILLYFMCV